MRIGVAVEGIEELTKGLNQINKDIRHDVLEVASMQAAEIVAEEARLNAPVTENPRSPHPPGLLRREGIAAKMLSRKGAATRVSAGVGFTKVGWFGKFLEVGTKFISARPMITPAFERRRAEIVQLIGNVTQRVIKKNTK